MSMVEKSAEEFAQRAFDLNLLSQRELKEAWDELGTREVSSEQLQQVLVRRGILTNYQVERLLRGEKTGFYHGDYKILYLVGTGTFARVYRAVHKDSGKVVACKVLRKRHSENPVETEQFLREGRMGSKLRHPNIVPILEVHSIKRTHFLVMEFVEGRDLRQFVRVRGKLSPEEAVRFTADIAAGLSYAFERGITHRDLKLSNVLMSSTGRAQLVDFGLAAATSDAEDGGEGTSQRTIDYAGLERCTGVRKDDDRSDIFFAGCMFYNMLTGVPPLSETRERMQRLSAGRYTNVKPIAEVAPEIPQRIMVVCRKAMDLDPLKRYQTPGEFHADLQAVLRHLKKAEELAGSDGDAVAVLDQLDEETLATPKTVMIVESNPEFQNLFREKLKKRGYRVLVIRDPERAIGRFTDDPQVADCVVFSCTDLGAAGLEGFNQAAKHGNAKKVPAILLLDRTQASWTEKAALTSNRVAVSMPIKMREFQATIEKLISETPASN